MKAFLKLIWATWNQHLGCPNGKPKFWRVSKMTFVHKLMTRCCRCMNNELCTVQKRVLTTFWQAGVQIKWPHHHQCRVSRPHRLQIRNLTHATAAGQPCWILYTGHPRVCSVVLHLKYKFFWISSRFFYCFFWRTENISPFLLESSLFVCLITPEVL